MWRDLIRRRFQSRRRSSLTAVCVGAAALAIAPGGASAQAESSASAMAASSSRASSGWPVLASGALFSPVGVSASLPAGSGGRASGAPNARREDPAFSPAAPAAGATGVDGLPKGTPLPAWASHRVIHFAPASPTAGRSRGSLSGATPELVAGEKGEQLKYYDGPVQTEPGLYLIFLGDNFWNGYGGNKGAVYAELKIFYENLATESLSAPEQAWQGILSQYAYVVGSYADAKIGGEWDVTGIAAPTNVTNAMIEEEVNTRVREFKAKGQIPSHTGAQFIVLLAPGSTYSKSEKIFKEACAYHAVTSENYSYTAVPYPGDLTREYEQAQEPWTCNEYNSASKPKLLEDEEARLKRKISVEEQMMYSATAFASHEFAESATDPLVLPEGPPYSKRYGWRVSEGGSGAEIADLCDSEMAWQLPLEYGRKYWTHVQELWDDEGANQCKLQSSAYPAPPAPAVTSGGASAITQTSASLAGEVNPGGPDANYYFEYGTTTAYGSHAPLSAADAGFGSATVPASATVSGLSPNTTYHYRLSAWNWTGTTNGGDRTFTTLPYPPEVKTLSPSEVRQRGVTFASSINPEGAETTYQFEYWPVGKEGEKVTVPAGGLSAGSGSTSVEKLYYLYSGLKPNSAYDYRVVAKNAGGTSTGGAVEFRTKYNPEVSEVASKNTLETSVTLTGTVNPDGAETTYYFEYWTGNEAHKRVPVSGVSVGAGEAGVPVSQEVTGLTASKIYSFELVASNAGGTTHSSVSRFGTPPVVFAGKSPFTAKLRSNLEMLFGGASERCSESNLAGQFASGSNVLNVTPTFGGCSFSVGGNGGSSVIKAGACEPNWTIAVPSQTGDVQLHCAVTIETGYGGCVITIPAQAQGARSGGEAFEWVNLGEPASSGELRFLNPSFEYTVNENCELFGLGPGMVTVSGGWSVPEVYSQGGASEWAVEPSSNPSGARGSYLFGDSCPVFYACEGVGDYVNSSGVEVTLAQLWNKTNWIVQTTPNASGAKRSTLWGVSCTSTSWCMAVGDDESSGGVMVTLTEIWNGSEWKVQWSPNPFGPPRASYLRSVSCVSSSSCYAVGEYVTIAGVTVTLAEVWNGSEWKVQSTPNPSGAIESALWSVSCTSASSCYAVGDYENSSKVTVTLAESWNGTEWTVKTTPNPTGAAASYLHSLSCTSASACTAIGRYVASSGTMISLAEAWNGTEWTLQTPPVPAGAKASWLWGVSCVTSPSSACQAIGSYENASNKWVTLADTSEAGAWRLKSTDNAYNATAVWPLGISCANTTTCQAIGNYQETGTGTTNTLSEGFQWF